MAWRGTESGQVLLDLVQHGDVAEWALWINSFGDSVYRALWGDKDTYALAFAVAGKAHAFNQLQVRRTAGRGGIACSVECMWLCRCCQDLHCRTSILISM